MRHNYLKFLTEIQQGHRRRKLCRSLCHRTQLSTNHDDDFPVVSPRITLRDGRHLAYMERGVPKDESKYKIIFVHGFGSTKKMHFPAPQELIDELGLYLVQYDRAGYGESDPNPKCSLKSEALDIEELADQLHIGAQFYVIGVSMGSCATWSCLKYLPHRLAGLALIAPTINYRWPSFPVSLIREDYRSTLVMLTLWLVKYCPRLLQCLITQTQNWLPSTSVIVKNPTFFNKTDMDILKAFPGFPMFSKERLKERVVFDTLCNDLLLAFGRWEFDPMMLRNPFPQKGSSFHIWQGYEDKIVPSKLQRFVSGKLPWIQYHEVPSGGHLILCNKGITEAILRALLLGENNKLVG